MDLSFSQWMIYGILFYIAWILADISCCFMCSKWFHFVNCPIDRRCYKTHNSEKKIDLKVGL